MEISKETYTENMVIFKWVRFSIIMLVLIICGCMYGCPQYNVYSESKSGEAEYQKAVHNRKIVIEEAEAKNQAAISEAEAKIKMANAENEAMIIKAQGQRTADSIIAIGVANANEIIGNSLKGNNEYLHYLWIDQLKQGSQKVYIPTEANLPILEAKSN